jgi:hypothetical protein
MDDAEPDVDDAGAVGRLAADAVSKKGGGKRGRPTSLPVRDGQAR